MPRMAGKRQIMSYSGTLTSATDECLMEGVKSVLECMCSTSCTAVVTEGRISPASVYRILTNSLGKRKVCAKYIPHILGNDHKAMDGLLATTYLQHWRNEDSAFYCDESWCVHLTLS
jgi:hypothetical protein